jgi:hypothetical protein
MVTNSERISVRMILMDEEMYSVIDTTSERAREKMRPIERRSVILSDSEKERAADHVRPKDSLIPRVSSTSIMRPLMPLKISVMVITSIGLRGAVHVRPSDSD